MQKYNDENIINDADAKLYNKELTERTNSALEIFEFYKNKIINQNILNIAGKILSLLDEEKKLLKEFAKHIGNRKNENEIYLKNIIGQEETIKVFYSLSDFQKLNFVKISQEKPLLKNAVDVAVITAHTYFELTKFEIDEKMKDIIRKYISENLDIVLYLTSFLV